MTVRLATTKSGPLSSRGLLWPKKDIMTTSTAPTAHLDAKTKRKEERRVLAGTLVGTSIEWYDFFIYAQAASLVFADLYFNPLAKDAPGLAQVISLATIGISFLFRPLGAIVAGHLGDKLGRKKMLVLTLMMMGVSTAAIGLVPTYATIGVAAPLLLMLLRVLQGFSAGGEWGGAALMAVEHAPKGRRSFFGAYPQIGVPIGMILATGVIFILQQILGMEAFLAWGWRITFLISIVLVIVGYLIRLAVAESPVFAELQERRAESSAPLGKLMKHNKREVLLSAFIFISNNAIGYLLIAFFIGFLAKREVDPLPLGPVLGATVVGSLGWLTFTFVGGWLGDKIGRVRTFQLGYALLAVWAIPMWMMIKQVKTVDDLWMYIVAVLIMTVGLGLSYGPQAALYAEMFPSSVRYSGVSIGYALGTVLGGAFAPMISQMILNRTGEPNMIGVYMIIVSAISFIAVSIVKDRPDRDLHIEDALQMREETRRTTARSFRD